jgi:competence protein ComEC
MRRRLQLWSRGHPLLLLALTAVAGILAAEALSPSPWPYLAAGLLLPLRPVRLPATALVFAGLHAWNLQQTFHHPLRQQLLETPNQRLHAEVRGELLPRNDSNDPRQALCRLTAVRLAGAPHFSPCQGWLSVWLPAGHPLKQAGLHELTGRLQLPDEPMNPAQFDFARHSLRLGRIAHFAADEVRLVSPAPLAPRFSFLRAAANCREWIANHLSRGVDPANPAAPIVLAMTLGIADAAGEEIEDAFRASGTLHVFAISGLHVVLLAGIALGALRWLGYQRCVLAVILLVFAYAFVTGWRPSAARAALMASVLLAAPLFNRRSRMANSLGAAALILLFADTQQLFLTGFQLSFGVLLSLLLFATPLVERLRPWFELDPFLPPHLASPGRRFSAWLRRQTASLTCVSLAAWLGSLPFLLGHFHSFSLIALVANLVLVPMAGWCLTLACASLLATLLPWAGASLLLNQANAELASLMAVCASLFASLPGATLNSRLQPPDAPASLRVFHLPGGGQAAHWRNGNQNWLLDTGNEAAWRRIVEPWLRSQGVNHLNGLVLSHADSAHTGAAARILQRPGTARVLTSQLEPWRYDPANSSLQRLTRLTPPDGPVWQRLALAAETNLGGARATVLHPGHGDRHEKADDRGLVLAWEHAGLRLLWLADAGYLTSRRLLERGLPLHCHIVLLSRHASDPEGITDLLAAANPRVVLLGAAGHAAVPGPTDRLRAFCNDRGILLWELEKTGSVGIDFRDGNALLTTFRGGGRLELRPAEASTTAQQGLHRIDNRLDRSQPPAAFVTAGQQTAVRTDKDRPTFPQDPHIGHSGRMLPHVAIHRRRNQQRRTRRQSDGGQRIIGKPMRECGEHVGGRRRDQQKVSLVSKLNVPWLPAVLLRQQVRDHRTARQGGQSQRCDKLQG